MMKKYGGKEKGSWKSYQEKKKLRNEGSCEGFKENEDGQQQQIKKEKRKKAKSLH